MNKKTIVIIAAVILIGIAALAGYPAFKNYMITKDPVNHIMYSAVKTGEETNANATISVKAEFDEKLALEQGAFASMSKDPEAMAKFANSLIKKFEILYDINMITENDTDLFKIDAGIGMNYSGKTIIDGKFYLKPWELGIKVPKLYKKPLYIDINEALEAEGSKINLNDIDFKAYIDILKKEDNLSKAVANNYEPYKNVVYNYLKDKVEKIGKDTITLNVYDQAKKVNVTKYKLNANILDVYDVYADVLQIAKEDEAVKALVQARVKEIKELIINNKDYEKIGLTEEEFNLGIKEIEDEIANNWAEGIDEVINEFKQVSSQPELAALDNLNNTFIVTIDKDNYIRQAEFEVQTEFVKVKETVSYNAFGKDVKVDIPKDEADKVNLLNVENDQALIEELSQEVVGNLVSELFGGEAIETLISDIKTEAKVLPDDESQQIINNVDAMINQIKMSLPFMLNGLGF